MLTTTDLAHETGRPIRTIRAAIERLGYRKTGRDYLLTDEQARAVVAEMRDGPGRPRKE